jgi:7-keto-8-aminopelargonate synthetase-like enzyme
LQNQLWSSVGVLRSEIRNPKSGIASAIIPLIIGDEPAAVAAAAKLREQGLFVPAIRYPTVARGAARLRITLSAAHSAADATALTRALATLDLGPQTSA